MRRIARFVLALSITIALMLSACATATVTKTTTVTESETRTQTITTTSSPADEECRSTGEEYRGIAQEYVENSPTFRFDGIEGSLELVETRRFDVKGCWLWEFVFRFQSAHAGYGDRSGQTLLPLITLHEAVVRIESGKIVRAVMDNTWDMLEQKPLTASASDFTSALAQAGRDSTGVEVLHFATGQKAVIASADPRFHELIKYLGQSTLVRAVLEQTVMVEDNKTSTASMAIPYPWGYILDFELGDGSTLRFNCADETVWFETDETIYEASAAPVLRALLESAVAQANPTPGEETPLPIAARKTAEDFIRNSSTFRFDGIEGSIRFIKDGPSPISAYRAWVYTFEYQTAHPGHGDRSGQVLAQVVTTHTADVYVNIDKNEVWYAVCDRTWDMIREKELPVYVSGIVISGGNTTTSGGPLDVPQIFVYKVLMEEGFLMNVSYTVWPLWCDVFHGVGLSFYGGDVRVGDEMEARGILDKETNTVVAAEQGDYVKTSPRKATVLGVVVGGGATTDAPEEYTYELLRDDGTFVNVRFTAKEGVALSLYSETIRVGDYMRAVGTYDRSTNTVIAAIEGDYVKTYDHKPL